MNKDNLKALLLRDKEFLKNLYQSKSSSHSKNILIFASDAKLNTLIKFFHFVANGHIKVKKEHFDKIQKRHLNLSKSLKVAAKLLMINFSINHKLKKLGKGSFKLVRKTQYVAAF